MRVVLCPDRPGRHGNADSPKPISACILQARYPERLQAKGSAPKRGPGPAATKTSAPKAGKLTASDFIRQHPGKTATELVELGKGQGLKFSGNLVYAVRAYDRKGAGAPKGKPGRKPGGNVATRASVTGDVAAFKKMALEIGFPRAREIVVALERKWNDLLALRANVREKVTPSEITVQAEQGETGMSDDERWALAGREAGDRSD